MRCRPDRWSMPLAVAYEPGFADSISTDLQRNAWAHRRGRQEFLPEICSEVRNVSFAASISEYRHASWVRACPPCARWQGVSREYNCNQQKLELLESYRSSSRDAFI